jgi:GT2 family glycosyltransferase
MRIACSSARRRTEVHVAVCIVGFRNTDDVRHCLAALGSSSYSDFEVVICENGGEEAYRSLAAALAPVLPGGQKVTIVLAEGNLGYAGGVNRCITVAPEADAWLVLNPDTQVAPDALGHLVERLERGDCHAVGATLYGSEGRVQGYGGSWRPWLARAESLGNGRSLDDGMDPAEVERRQSYILGACMLVGRAFVERVGLMREDYFLYCEEIEWSLRAIAKGLRLGFAPKALILHEQGTATGSRPDLTQRSRLSVYLDERNKILVTRDRFPGRIVLAAPSALLLIFLRFARRGAWRQTGYAVQGWFAGLRNERGVPAGLLRG